MKSETITGVQLKVGPTEYSIPFLSIIEMDFYAEEGIFRCMFRTEEGVHACKTLMTLVEYRTIQNLMEKFFNEYRKEKT